MKCMPFIMGLCLWTSAAVGQPVANCVPDMLLRQGLTIGVSVCAQDPPVDEQRIKAQRAQGCAASDVRFGDIALMRGSLDGLEWSHSERRALSTAALSDDLEIALGPLGKSIERIGVTSVKGIVLTHQAVLTALQFQEVQRAKALLSGLTLTEDVPKDIAFDHVFLGIMADVPGAGAERWRADLLPRLDSLKIDDTRAFGLRVWRLYGWFLARQYEKAETCDLIIADFMTRVLDVSEASACPLLLGHVEHALDRRLRAASYIVSVEESAWRLLAGGVLASVSGRDAAASLAQTFLDSAETPCASRLSAALAVTQAAAQGVGQ